MRRRVFRVLLALIAARAVASIVGMILSKRLAKGNETTDEFQVAAIMGGRKFESHARHLRSGTAIASMGGIDLDLRDAILDPSGAELELKATMGGIQLTIPDHWYVEVDADNIAGGIEVDVTPPEELPEGAPKLHIRAVTRLGGGLVTAQAS
jgi:predicted membrane protein